MRRATMLDCAHVFRWRTEEAAVQFSPGAVPTWEQHTAWFVATLGSTTRELYIAETCGKKVGMGRIDRTERGAVLSVAVDPAWRGQGFATRIIERLTARARAWHPGEPIIADIKTENVASLRAFMRAGFRLRGESVVVEA